MSKAQYRKIEPFLDLAAIYKKFMAKIKNFEDQIPCEDPDEEQNRIKKIFSSFDYLDFLLVLEGRGPISSLTKKNIAILPSLTWLKNKQKFSPELSLEVLFHQFGFPKFDYECNLKQKVQLSDIIGFLEEEFLQAPEITDALLHARLLNNLDKEKRLRLQFMSYAIRDSGVKSDRGHVAKFKECLESYMQDQAHIYASDVKAYASKNKQRKRLEKVRHTRPSKGFRSFAKASFIADTSLLVLAAVAAYSIMFAICLGVTGLPAFFAVPSVLAIMLLSLMAGLLLVGGIAAAGALVNLGVSVVSSELRNHYNGQFSKTKRLFNKIKQIEASYELIHEIVPLCEQVPLAKTMDGTPNAFRPLFSVKETLKAKRYESLNQLDNESEVEPNPGQLVLFR